MSVYVDTLTSPGPRWFGAYCHLLADSVPELTLFAESLGLRRAWLQTKRLPHYDLTEGMRARAVAAGAIEITRSQVVEMMRGKKERET